MRKKLSLELRRELLTRTAEDYTSARKGIKSQIVDQLVAATGYGRKHAITLLNHPPGSVSSSRPRRARYDERVKRALVTLWTTANRICAKRLVPFLPELIEVIERHGHLSLPADVREKLLTISPATADRLLASERSSRHGLSTTRPGSLLKKQIKVRTFADWDDLQPGFLEADLVAHCGESAAGSFLHTLVLVDVATGWTECVALLRRSEADVIGALNSLRGRLPVPLLGLDTDNGSEFINYEMLRYCQREQITFTRSRVNRKNDQAFVEEKNGSVVRRLIGYDRYEGLGAWRALIQLYEILRLYVNFFQPSMKLIEKQRDGARVKKRYDRAQTPYQRVIASAYLTKRKRERIESLYWKLDPVSLLKELERRQDHFWTFANGQRELEGNDSPRAMDAVVRKYLVEITASQEPSGIRRYRRTKKPRTWRTRKDPFAEAQRRALWLESIGTVRLEGTRRRMDRPGVPAQWCLHPGAMVHFLACSSRAVAPPVFTLWSNGGWRARTLCRTSAVWAACAGSSAGGSPRRKCCCGGCSLWTTCWSARSWHGFPPSWRRCAALKASASHANGFPCEAIEGPCGKNPVLLCAQVADCRGGRQSSLRICRSRALDR